MLCWEAVGVSEPIPHSRLAKTHLSSPAGSEWQPRAGAGCAVLHVGNKSCLSPVEPAWWSQHCGMVVMSSAVFPLGIPVC